MLYHVSLFISICIWNIEYMMRFMIVTDRILLYAFNFNTWFEIIVC